MKLYIVYNTDDDGFRLCVDSYWLDYSIAVARFKKIWPYSRESFKSEIDFHVKEIKTKDQEIQ